jgi:hypothetical protein
MAFPTGTITTVNLDSSADDPSLARTDLYNAVVALNTIIDGRDQADGVALLDNNGVIPTARIPATILVTGDLTLQPSTRIVNVRDILRMTAWTTADVALIPTVATPILGDVIVVSDGDAGDPCLALFDGTDWLRISLGAEISAT